jgi:hypothetical protein
MDAWVVLRDTGEYSDRSREVIGVATTQDGARALAERHAEMVARDEYEDRKEWLGDEATSDVGWRREWVVGPETPLDTDVAPDTMRRYFGAPHAYEAGHYEITRQTLEGMNE